MSTETPMTDEVKTVAEEIPSWAQILMTELCSMKSYTEEDMQNMKAYTDLFYIFVMNWDNLTSTTLINTAMSWVCNEIDAQLIISKYKKNTMKREKRASYRSKKIMCFSLRVLVSN